MRLKITIELQPNDFTYRVVSQALLALSTKMARRVKAPDMEDHGKVVADGRVIGRWEWV